MLTEFAACSRGHTKVAPRPARQWGNGVRTRRPAGAVRWTQMEKTSMSLPHACSIARPPLFHQLLAKGPRSASAIPPTSSPSFRVFLECSSSKPAARDRAPKIRRGINRLSVRRVRVQVFNCPPHTLSELFQAVIAAAKGRTIVLLFPEKDPAADEATGPAVRVLTAPSAWPA